jgi:hypothetical protein
MQAAAVGSDGENIGPENRKIEIVIAHEGQLGSVGFPGQVAVFIKLPFGMGPDPLGLICVGVISTRQLNRQALGSIGDLWMFEIFHNPSGQLLQFSQM